MNNVQRFLESIEVQNTFKVMNFVLKNVDDNIESYSLMELEQFILSKNPNSPKAIITICYVLGTYAKWLKENGLDSNDCFYNVVQLIDKKMLWKKAKPNAKKKFISNEQFKFIIHEINMYEEYNSLYYQTLFKCIYEGIFNNGLSVIKNLRSSDINVDKNIVTLNEDNGHSYKLIISEKLASELKELASIDIWERKNRYGTCQIKMSGVHYDSVFKTEHRETDSDGTYAHSYYARLRKISKEYIEHNLSPFQLYVSGIMYRIKVELSKHNITLEKAFAEDSRERISYGIISKELIRCNYEGGVSHFKELVKGNIDCF